MHRRLENGHGVMLGVLQDAGLTCFEYVEQLTLLLFLKMADQLTEAPHNESR